MFENTKMYTTRSNRNTCKVQHFQKLNEGYFIYKQIYGGNKCLNRRSTDASLHHSWVVALRVRAVRVWVTRAACGSRTVQLVVVVVAAAAVAAAAAAVG